MLDLDLLNQDFEPTDKPGLSTLDPRFQDIAACIPDGKYKEAAEQTQSVLAEGILDIRLIGYFLFGVFSERGPLGFKGMYEALTRLLRDNWEALGPAKKKDKITDKSFVWLFKQILQALKYHESKQDETYQGWLAKASWDELEACLEQMNNFRRAIPHVIDNPGCMQLFQGMVAWLEDFQKLVQAQEEERKAAEAAAAAAAAPEPEPEPEEGAPAGGGSGGSSNGRSGAMVEGSYPLQRLMAKLTAFEQLIGRADLPKASLVALDIGETLGNFDPKIYFPKLFSGYFTLLSRHVEELAEYWDMRESVSWQAMEQLYQVDLDAFMNL